MRSAWATKWLRSVSTCTEACGGPALEPANNCEGTPPRPKAGVELAARCAVVEGGVEKDLGAHRLPPPKPTSRRATPSDAATPHIGRGSSCGSCCRRKASCGSGSRCNSCCDSNRRPGSSCGSARRPICTRRSSSSSNRVGRICSGGRKTCECGKGCDCSTDPDLATPSFALDAPDVSAASLPACNCVSTKAKRLVRQADSPAISSRAGCSLAGGGAAKIHRGRASFCSDAPGAAVASRVCLSSGDVAEIKGPSGVAESAVANSASSSA
mmetsp:Transcript_130358/g.377121  ORF Transcript_130358/g.377121 Transcript_130358/m.377121 type:complete len:269 (+) Transcript_130358:467-1273(+)